MSEHDFKLNVDSLIDRLLEGEWKLHVNKYIGLCRTAYTMCAVELGETLKNQKRKFKFRINNRNERSREIVIFV